MQVPNKNNLRDATVNGGNEKHAGFILYMYDQKYNDVIKSYPFFHKITLKRPSPDVYLVFNGIRTQKSPPRLNFDLHGWLTDQKTKFTEQDTATLVRHTAVQSVDELCDLEDQRLKDVLEE